MRQEIKKSGIVFSSYAPKSRECRGNFQMDPNGHELPHRVSADDNIRLRAIYYFPPLTGGIKGG